MPWQWGMVGTLVDTSLVYTHIVYFHYVPLILGLSEYLPPTLIYRITSLQVSS